MLFKSLIAGSALVFTLGVGSAIAGDTLDKTTIAPQNFKILSDGLLAKAAPMPAADRGIAPHFHNPAALPPRSFAPIVHPGYRGTGRTGSPGSGAPDRRNRDG